jgi:uncharacterized protein YggE
MNLIPATWLSLTIMALALSTAMAQESEERSAKPYLSVIGHGKVTAVPDVADINIGVVSQGPTAKDALRDNSDAMVNLHKVLKERGVAAKDIETTQVQVSPVYSHPGARQPTQTEEFVPKVAGYRVVNTIDVTARDVHKLGEMLDAVVHAGANQINGISFRVEKAEELLDEARRRAMADAKRKATLLAGEAGVVLGPARQIVESGSSPPRPTYLGAPMFQQTSPRSAPPVAAGEQELTVSIQVSYAIMPPKS